MTHLLESPGDIDRRIDELFGDTPRRPLRLWGTVAAIAVAAVVVVALIASSASAGSAAGDYRTATTEIRDVNAQLWSVATIEPVSRAAVTFPTSGTVATLDVVVGDTVAVGEQLATLDVAALTRTLNQKQEALTQAELTLSRALAGESVTDGPSGQSVTPTSSSATGSAGTGSTGTGSTGAEWASSSSTTEWASASGQAVFAVAAQTPASTTTSTDPELSALQQAVLDAQRAAEAAIADSNAAVASARSVCTDLGADVDTDDGSGTTSTTTVDACIAAIEQVQSSQDATAAAQQQLASASSALDAYLADLATDLGTDPTGDARTEDGSAAPGSTGATAPSGGVPSSGGSAPASGQSSGSTASAAELVAYQKAVSAAELRVLVAEQAVAQATIIAPIAGTVTSIGFEAGDDVTAASASQMIVIEGDDGVEVVTTVSLTDISSVEVGQSATVVPDGHSEPLDGEVVAVSVVPEDDQSTGAFRVTIGLTDPDADIGSGTTGTVTIETADARQVLAVPSSAVSWQDDRATLRILDDGVASERTVEVGVIGSDWVEITDGVDEGATVVLADLSQPLPGSAEATTVDQANFAGPGGFGPPGG